MSYTSTLKCSLDVLSATLDSILESTSCFFFKFGDKVDSKSGKALFNKNAWKKANDVLVEVLLGHCSYPPGYAFYSYKLSIKAELMQNKYSFPLLHCNRGTNDVEVFKELILTVFKTWVMGVEMSDCLMTERWHRHNHRCSEKRRNGFPKVGHYDTWLIDSLQNLVHKKHSVILFPEWSNTSDFMQTNESFGTITLHSKELREKIQSISIDQFSCNLTSDMRYLCKTIGTKLPLLPVHGFPEKNL